MKKLDPKEFIIKTRDIAKKYGKRNRTVWVKPHHYGSDQKTRLHAGIYLRILENHGLVKRVSNNKYILEEEFKEQLMGCTYPQCSQCHSKICLMKIFDKLRNQKLSYNKLRDVRLSELSSTAWRYVTKTILSAKPIEE